jgi:putative endonuclease
MPHPAISGHWAEQRALRLLQLQGWHLLSRNWHCRWGELDLVMAKPQRLLVVEVKGRACGNHDGGGMAALRSAKRRRLERSISCWLLDHPDHGDAAIDLIAALVPLPPRRKPVRWVRLSDW